MQSQAKCGRCFKYAEVIVERNDYKDEREKMSNKLRSKYAKLNIFFTNLKSQIFTEHLLGLFEISISCVIHENWKLSDKVTFHSYFSII